jgi:sialic acid synthase SpsE/quercetin dioxygenase-like cupin family protein|tara:strand:+ start:8282 stop:9793 length:1512 start_codon:yes stop_codon:yes gene_type:complete
MTKNFDKLFILEFANNHMGDVKHGLTMIKEFAKVRSKFEQFTFAVKFQFRDLDTFIHPDFKKRTDLKYVKRFSETRLTREEFTLLKNEAEKAGFKTVCTAFDEASVDSIREMNFDFIKIASCSFTDWPLLNKIVETDLPIIASTAGSTLEQIDNVVSFFKNRDKELAIMHCVGEYPTQEENLQINQIEFLNNRYQNMPIGFSTHEEPDNFDSVMIAVAKGANLFEKHVAVVTEKYDKNAYSCTPEQMTQWLISATRAFNMCGKVGTRHNLSEKEASDLRRFKRGVFATTKIKKGQTIDRFNTFPAWPPQEGQILANDMSKYTHFVAQKDFEPNEAIFDSIDQTQRVETREKVWSIVQDVKKFLGQSGVVYPGEAKLEISHHYGIDNFKETGITMITVVNREYCKKLIIVLPGQTHPEQYHKLKEETFLVLYGRLNLLLDGVSHDLTRGNVITVEPGVRHELATTTGCVIEEVSSTHYKDDSYYTDETISQNPSRKTFITHWID